MRLVRCSYCLSNNPGVGQSAGFHRSDRFPTVFLHHSCTVRMREEYSRLFEGHAIHWKHPLIDDLTWWVKK